MRRVFIAAVALLLSLDAFALGPWSPARKSVEGYGHISVSTGTNYSAGAAFIWGKQHTKGFFLGAGAGLRYVHSVHEMEDLEDGSRILYYGDEGVVPVFVRARFGRVLTDRFRPFLTVDIGGAINLSQDGNTKGFFFEPQIGLDLSENFYLTLGVDIYHFLSRSIINVGDVIGTIRDPQRKAKEIMASGLSLHLGYSF
ncbi:MAG: hypothetical protein IKQ64_06045 [Bacteroidales bacterium]|nr:hypothetical protein [Bacteroidales bacterium]